MKQRERAGGHRPHELFGTRYMRSYRHIDDPPVVKLKYEDGVPFDDQDKEYYESDDNDGRGAEYDAECPSCAVRACQLLGLLCCSDPGDPADSPLVTSCMLLCIVLSTFALLFLVVYLANLNRAQIVLNDAAALGSPLRNYSSVPRWVDVVYTYVNGTNEHVVQQLLSASAAGQLPYRAHASRFRDDGLLEYALRSLLAAKGLMTSIRNVYIVTSGEIPSWLPKHRLQPVGPGADVAASGAAADEATSCHARSGFTKTTLSMPLQPLISASDGSGGNDVDRADDLRYALAGDKRLFVVPHSAIFPDPSIELPTFNSNAILAVLHRIPGLADWYLYSDDDSIITNKELTLDAWWDAPRSAQKLYFTPRNGISRRRPHLQNNWEEAMSYMASILDEVGGPSGQRPAKDGNSDSQQRPWWRRFGWTNTAVSPSPPPPLSMPPPLPVYFSWPPVAPCPTPEVLEVKNRTDASAPTTNALSENRQSSAVASQISSVASSISNRQHRGGLVRYYARPQHMPVLFSRRLVAQLEALWPNDFARTRRNKLRLGQEIELNFFYHHYLRVTRHAVAVVPSSRVEFLYAHRCARSERGEARCSKLLTQKDSDFVTFNDDATNSARFEAGLSVIHSLLRARYPGRNLTNS